jgi:hypothetical protein
MFCALGLVFGGTEGAGFRFPVLRSRTRFRRCRGRRSRIHILRSRTHFRRYQGRRVQFSYFALSNSFSAVPRASGPVFIFCALRLVLGDTAGVVSICHTSGCQTRFRRYRGSRFQFSYFALDTFWAVPRAPCPDFMFGAPEVIFDGTEGAGPVFIFCAPGLILGGTVGADFDFHISRSRSRFGRYRCCRVPFSYFTLPDSFSATPRVFGLVFMFCTLGLVLINTEGIGSSFHVLSSRATVPRSSGPVFMFCAPGLILGSTEGVRSNFHVLRSGSRFGWYRRLWVPFLCFALPDLFSAVSRLSVPFSCFALSDSFSVVLRAPGPVFMFCAHGPVLGDTEGVVSRFHVLHSRTRFYGTEGVGSCFHLLRSQIRFGRF